MKRTPIVLALAAIAACSSTGPSGPARVYTVEVAPTLGECMSWVYSWPCLQVRTAPDGAFQSQLTSIEGFAFEWGHEYILQVEEYIIPDPPADGSSRRYELVRVLSDRTLPPGTEFTYIAYSESRSILRKDGGNLRMFLDLTMPCGADCEALGAAIDAEHRFELRMQLTGNKETPVALIDWTSCPATASPFECDE